MVDTLHTPSTANPASAVYKPLTVTVTVGDAKVSMQVAGTGQPLVLFHSLLADRSSFDRIAPQLAATHMVIALDLPGFAASEAAPDEGAGSLAAVADRVAGAIAELHLTDKPVFIGNGYGGFVALLTAIRYPDLAERLVLADCGACFSEPGRAAFRGMSAGVAKGGLAAIADVAMRRLFAPSFQADHPELLAERRERFLQIAPPVFHAACQALATLDLRERLAGVKQPALVLVGELDEATPPPMSHELAAGLPDARLLVLPGLAHVPQLQAPEVFLAAIADFIGA
jgi:3-oxoadipate enol-lactonase